MKAQALDPLTERVLRALFELAQCNIGAHAGVVGRALGLRPSDVARVLLVLDARGLARADRARLTLAGLAVAARLPALQLEVAARLRELASAERGPKLARTGELHARATKAKGA
jgi:hypothetical protein